MVMQLQREEKIAEGHQTKIYKYNLQLELNSLGYVPGRGKKLWSLALKAHETKLKLSTGSDSSSMDAAWKQSAASASLPSSL